MKFLYGFFNQKTGKSEVTLADKYGIYTGRAKLHPNDKNNASKFTGCRLAETRALLNYLKIKYKRTKIALDAIKNLNNDIKLNCQNIDSKIQRRINLKLRDYSNEINEIKKDINALEKNLIEDIETRDKILNSIKKKGS